MLPRPPAAATACVLLAGLQNFWRYWNNLVDVDKLPEGANFRLFKAGIRPLWEDPANLNGGKFVIFCTGKAMTRELWYEIILAMIGEQLEWSEDMVRRGLHRRASLTVCAARCVASVGLCCPYGRWRRATPSTSGTAPAPTPSAAKASLMLCARCSS